jgi:hypothetical protein
LGEVVKLEPTKEKKTRHVDSYGKREAVTALTNVQNLSNPVDLQLFYLFKKMIFN